MHICLKEGYTSLDQLKAWVHAEEIGRAWTAESIDIGDDPAVIVESTYQTVDAHFTAFVEQMRTSGWNLDEGALMTGSPQAIFVSAEEGLVRISDQEKKDI